MTASDEKHDLHSTNTQTQNTSNGTPQDFPSTGPVAHEEVLSQSADHEIEHGEAPPPYGEVFGEVVEGDVESGTGASLAADGRVNIRINQQTKGLQSLLVPALRSSIDLRQFGPEPPPYVPPTLASPRDRLKPPCLNVVIHVVGSRGDVQPFVALAKVLKSEYGHRVRLATHPVFRQFVEEHGLEFFNIGGDPSELMAFMVKNPGLMPGFDTLRSGDVGKRRKEIYNMVKLCWRSCIEAGDGSGLEASDKNIEDWADLDSGTSDQQRPFVADCIIANPPSFAHIHCAERLGIPLHMMFTMPWSPTQSFPHPLANIQSTNTETNVANFISYALVDMMTWQGLGDVINIFRQRTLGLEAMSLTWAPGVLARLQIPWTYCWSPALIPKPRDWSSHVSVSGFYFLSLAQNYTPPPDLKAFLDAGPPPVYIGFGSIVLDDPNAMTKLIFDAVKKTGQRALVSKGWGGFGAEDFGIPENVFMLGNVPHDWLFKRVSCVVHHGGAGTTATGISCGKPTVVVPFFGDQPFWGAMINRAGAGPKPIHNKDLTSKLLAEAIEEALRPETLEKAKEMSEKISQEKGCESGCQSFHGQLDVDKMRCQLSPWRPAVWRIRRTQIRLSAFAATILSNKGLIDFKDLKLYRPTEYDADDGPWEPITGTAGALAGTIGSMTMGIADLPVAALKALKIHPDATKKKKKSKSESEGLDTVSQKAPKKSDGTETELSTLDSRRSSSPTLVDNAPAIAQNVVENQLTANESDETLVHSDTRSTDQASRTESTASPAPTSEGKEKGKKAKRNLTKDDVDNALQSGKGAYKFVTAGIKSPMDVTVALAKGNHNAPKLYGDDTVRKHDKITDLSSGLKAAGKEFGYGFYDGISGLVTQPLAGAKKEGAPGLVKGFGKGIGGIVFKPAAAVFALPGYTFKGIYREIRKNSGPSVDGYIVAARTVQGYEEVRDSSPQERDQVVNDYKELRRFIYKKKNFETEVRELQERIHERAGLQHQRPSATASTADLKAPEQDVYRTQTQGTTSSGVYSQADSSSTDQHPLSRLQTAQAQAAIAAGSNDQPDTPNSSIPPGSVISTGSSPRLSAEHPPAYTPSESTDTFPPDTKPSLSPPPSVALVPPRKPVPKKDPELEEAIRRSIREDATSGNAEQDAAMERAIEESATAIAATRGHEPSAREEDEDDEEVKKAMEESMRQTSGAGEADVDEDYRRVLTESKETHEQEQMELERVRKEEETVMKYVMRQSEAEAAFKKGKAGEQHAGSGSGG